MIVVDTNVIACLFLPGDFTERAERLLSTDSDWIVPHLWRSEFRNIHALHIRTNLLSFEQAFQIQREAEEQLADREYDVDSFEVLNLASQSGHSAYDCEFVALAKRLRVKLVTADAKLLKSFPADAVDLRALA